MGTLLLTDEQRGRLRPTVDVAALERLLAELPEASRPGVVLACVAAPRWEEIAAEAARAGAPARPAPACASGLPPTAADRGSAAGPTLQIAFKNPALQQLWLDVEPGPR